MRAVCLDLVDPTNSQQAISSSELPASFNPILANTAVQVLVCDPFAAVCVTLLPQYAWTWLTQPNESKLSAAVNCQLPSASL
jgi:hypothetical protein